MSDSYVWTIERQIQYPLIEDAVLSPDGTRAIAVVREALMTDERSEFLTHLYLAGANGALTQLTFGDTSNYSPRWSPDGRYIAFVSRRSGRANLFVMQAGGGEAWALTRFEKSDVSDLKWSRDGTRIAFLMPDPPDEAREKAQKARDDAQVWGENLAYAQLRIVPFSVGPRMLPPVKQVTRGPAHVLQYDWLPGDSGFAYTAQPSPVADTWPETWLATIGLDGGAEPQRIATLASWGPKPFVSPDGAWIACVASEGPPRWAFDWRVVVYPIVGGEGRRLHDTPDSQQAIVGWSPDSRQVYVWENSGVAAQLYALALDGAAPQPLRAPAFFSQVNMNAGGKAVFVAEDFDQPNALHVADLVAGSEAAVLAAPALPAGWPAAALPRAEVLRWKSADGTEIEGIVTYPLGNQAGPAPLVVIVHGGPTGVFQRSYLGTYIGYGHLCGLAERGYATLRVNPRGSSGYGRAFRFANDQDWGGGDYADIMAGVDTLIERGIADGDRLGIMGWSYGGFMTSWAITQTQRFKAACVGAAVTSLASFNGTADIPSFVPDYFGGEFWDDDTLYRKHSPVYQADRVITPALVQHGQDDIRVPLSQGREFYNALKRRGVPTELVIYPRQGHAFNEPRLIIDVRKRSLAWFDRYMLGT
ncbi:MAG TPA: S9 family peptidase [Roseiflexaceae bacterium]|nr:S9 family peptidase [Roseiflexaceae bacterium]